MNEQACPNCGKILALDDALDIQDFECSYCYTKIHAEHGCIAGSQQILEEKEHHADAMPKCQLVGKNDKQKNKNEMPQTVLWGFLIPAIYWLIIVIDYCSVHGFSGCIWYLALGWGLLIIGLVSAAAGNFWIRWLCLILAVFSFLGLFDHWVWFVFWFVSVPLVVISCLFFSPSANEWIKKTQKSLTCPHCGGELPDPDVTACCHCGRDVTPSNAIEEGAK